MEKETDKKIKQEKEGTKNRSPYTINRIFRPEFEVLQIDSQLVVRTVRELVKRFETEPKLAAQFSEALAVLGPRTVEVLVDVLWDPVNCFCVYYDHAYGGDVVDYN